MPSPRRSSLVRQGFTLIELLVVIGIIVLLMGLALPAIIRSYRSAVRTRTQADLALIGTALEAYKQDFGDYPRFADSSATVNWLDKRTDRGAVLLCRALIGPAPMGTAADVDTTTAQNGADGADGPGFRVRRSISTINGTTVVTGKVYGPYVQPDKFALGGMDKNYFTDATINDRNNNPILYYPAIPNHAAITMGNGYVASNNPGSPNTIKPLYNAFDNTICATSPTPPATAQVYLPVPEIQKLLNADLSGAVAAGKSAAYTGPYILWTAGADGIYGRAPDGKSDDVTNFDLPADLRK